MSGSARSCCVPQCGKTRADNIILHVFPDPSKEIERFNMWVSAVGITSLDNSYIFKNRKICHNHFEVKYLTWTRRLTIDAVPTLYIPGLEVSDVIMRDISNAPKSNVVTWNIKNTIDSNSRATFSSTSAGINSMSSFGDEDSNCSFGSTSILPQDVSDKTEKKHVVTLYELCLRVINSKKCLFGKKIVSDVSKQIAGADHDVTYIPTDEEDTVLLEDNFDDEEVTLLKDSYMQPSLKTFLREIEMMPSSTRLLRDIEMMPSSPDNILNLDSFETENLMNTSEMMSFRSSLFEQVRSPLAAIDENIQADTTHSENGDFSPDDNDVEYRPDNNILSDTSAESIVPENGTNRKRRAKRGKAVKECWVTEIRKNKRMKGLTYEGRRKTEEGKIVFDQKKKKRSLKPRCCHAEDARYFKCHKISDEFRKKTFEDFWSLSWQAKKVWIKQLVTCEALSSRSRRGFNYKYTLNGEKVCKHMFLNTFCLGEWSVHHWVKSEEPAPTLQKKNRNISIKQNETEKRRKVKEFLDKLPKLESHYCRKSTQKLYLEPKWNSKEGLFREYVNYLKNNENEAFTVSRYVFWEEFEAINLSLFSPKKDECDICCAKKVGNLTDEAYAEHILRKDTARQEKENDKSLSDPSVKVFTFDLQAVLLAPSLNASALYYKTKLKVHNFTIFDLNTCDGFCFIWNESEGNVTADEFASIIFKFLNEKIDTMVRHVIFWSDGCTNQNRNAILANALLLIAVQKSITITHKYLEKGHTQMECDSMHSTIERKLKHREIYSPAQYIDVCRSARLRPYDVKYLEHTYFKKFSKLPYLNSIRPGKKVGDATVFDLRVIEYRSDGTIWYKKNFADEFTQLAKKIKMPGINDDIPPLYESRIAIPRNKYIHLQELKAVLPRDVHSFYDEIPHICSEQRRNTNCNCKRS